MNTYQVSIVSGIQENQIGFTVQEEAESLSDLITKLQHCNGIIGKECDGISYSGQWNVIGARITKIVMIKNSTF